MYTWEIFSFKSIEHQDFSILSDENDQYKVGYCETVSAPKTVTSKPAIHFRSKM